jgi:hypothetical protein
MPACDYFRKNIYHAVLIYFYFNNTPLIHAMMLKKRWRNLRILAIVVTKNGTMGNMEYPIASPLLGRVEPRNPTNDPILPGRAPKRGAERKPNKSRRYPW